MFLNGVPFFVFGMLPVALFSITLGWFPAMGAYGPGRCGGFSWTFFKSVGCTTTSPFFSCFPILSPVQATGMRSMSIYELGTDYMKYAKWLGGLREGKIIGYVFPQRDASAARWSRPVPGSMVGGALITEMIFSYPGPVWRCSLPFSRMTATIQGLHAYDFDLPCSFAVVLIALFDPRVQGRSADGRQIIY